MTLKTQTITAVFLLMEIMLCSAIEQHQLTDDDRRMVVDYHNKVRSRLNPPASNMRRIYWDMEMERLAERWAKKCVFHHPWLSENVPKDELDMYTNTSQSLVHQRGLNPYNFRQMLAALEKEGKFYRYGDQECLQNQQCVHYINMITAESYKVACVKHYCPPNTLFNSDATLFVCQYAPGTHSYESGEQNHLDVPYKTGAPCSQCGRDETCDSKTNLCVVDNSLGETGLFTSGVARTVPANAALVSMAILLSRFI